MYGLLLVTILFSVVSLARGTSSRPDVSIKIHNGNKVIAKIRKTECYNNFDQNADCVAAVQKYNEGDTLSIRDMNVCNKSIALQIAVMETETAGPAVSIADSVPVEGSSVLAVGACRGLTYGYFRVTDMFNDVLSITDPAQNTTAVQTCPGDSGGQYFEKSANNEIQLLAVHTMGSWGQSEGVINKKKLKFPAYWHAGTNLNDPPVMAVLQEMIQKHDVEICGINKICDPVTWLYE